MFVVDAAAKQTTCFYETTTVFMFPVQCALASPTLDGFCLACISPRIQHNVHCSVIAVAWSNHIQQPRILQLQTVTAVTLHKMAAKMQNTPSTQFWTPEAILISRRSFSFPSPTSSGATAVIRHSQTTSATSSCNSLKQSALHL